MGTREGRYMFKYPFVFICFSMFICVSYSEDYNKFIEHRSELPRNSIFKSAKINNPDGWQFEPLPRSIPLSEKNSNYKVPVTIPLYFTPSLRFKRRIYRNFNSCSQLTYSGYNLDRNSNGFCTTASECLESALLSSGNIKRENEHLLKNVIKLTSNVFQPTCLYTDSNGFMKYGVCCKKNINKPFENIKEILNESFIIEIDPKRDDIYTYKTRENSPLIDRGHIFSRPKKNVPEVDESNFVTSASSTKFKIDPWEYPYPNFHPTHPPIITHPPEHTNKPWWTTRSPLTTTTETPSKQHDWWEIRKTDKPNWWQQQTTTPRPTLPPLEEGTTTRRPNRWQLDTTRWWVQRYTTSSPKTTTWQRHFTTSTTTTTTTPTTTTTTTTTTRPSLDKVEAFCLPSFYKKAKNLPVFGKEERDEGEATRITGGTKIYPHSYPWIAVLFQSDKHVCGGSLIDDTHVLTAAHCVATLSSWQLKRMRVYLGMHDLSRSEASRQAYSIKTVVRHKDYSRSLLYNDIALLTLNERVRFTDQVHPVCLYEGSDMFNNDVATVAGWGSLYEGGNQLDTPRKVDLRIWSNEDCRLAYGPAAPGGIISSHLCAGKIGKDACSGDSGGPIMKEINGVWMQIGIVSWGIGCGKGHYPGVYSRISTFLPWIRKVQLEY